MNKLSLSYRGLLFIYIVIPIAVVICGIDAVIYEGILQRRLPRDPEELRILTVFFVLPHIFASAISFIDKEYLGFYRNKLLWGVPFILFLVFGLPELIGQIGSYIVYATYTVYHVMMQQVGIATVMVGPPSKLFKIWKWFSVLSACVIYLSIYGALDYWSPYVGTILLIDLIYFSLALLFIPYIFLSSRIANKSQTEIGKHYLMANTAMIVFALGLAVSKYYFFAILVPRIIHDISAFAFYTVHDHNRNLEVKRNMLFKFLSLLKVPTALLSPLLALILANVFIELKDHPAVASGLLMLIYFHYYSEGIMWKRESAHRTEIQFAKPQWTS